MNPAPEKEYNLELRAKIDENLGDFIDRDYRARWLLRTMKRRFCDTSWCNIPSMMRNWLEGFGDVPIKAREEGIISENRTWMCIEFDELVFAIPMGWMPTIGELMCYYGLHGERIGIEILVSDYGIVYQNANQITTDDFFYKFQSMEFEDDPIPTRRNVDNVAQ